MFWCFFLGFIIICIYIFCPYSKEDENCRKESSQTVDFPKDCRMGVRSSGIDLSARRQMWWMRKIKASLDWHNRSKKSTRKEVNMGLKQKKENYIVGAFASKLRALLARLALFGVTLTPKHKTQLPKYSRIKNIKCSDFPPSAESSKKRSLRRLVLLFGWCLDSLRA